MISWFDIYLISRLDCLCSIFKIGGALSGLALLGSLIGVIWNLIESLDWKKRIESYGSYRGYESCYNPSIHFKETFQKISKWLCVPVIILWLGILTVPTTKEAVAIWAIPKIANNEQVQKIPENFAKLINDKLQEWMIDTEILPRPEQKTEEKK